MGAEHPCVLSCSTVAFDGYDLDTAFIKIAELGFSWIELGFIDGYVSSFSETLFGKESARVVRALQASTGLRLSAVSAHIDLGYPESLEKIERRIGFCAELGCPRLITNGAASTREGEFYRTMERVVPAAESAGVTICLENPGNGERNVVNDGVSSAHVAQRIASPFVRINYDGGNTFSHFKTRFPAERDFEPALPWLEQLHLKDVALRSDGEYEYPALGDGQLDFARMAATLGESSAVSALSLEIPLRLRRRPNASPYRIDPPLSLDRIVSALRRSRQLVQTEFRGVLAE
jgi:sugar phosphate isomerase/epimerase